MYANSKIEDDSMYHKIDLRSDTISEPTLLMRKAMSDAVVGDDVYGEDPTVVELEKRAASLFGKEAALFVTSGTLSNLLAVMVHCDTRCCELIAGDMSHTFLYEQCGAATFAGVQITQIKNNPDGTFDLNEIKNRIRGNDIHECQTKLVCIENTHNMCGGKVLPLSWINHVAEICKENNLLLHMDGARVFNAAEYLKVSVSEIVSQIDSVSVCLSKGLSAPVGSLLIGKKDFIEKARRCRKGIGGGMRQVGILAAAGLVALDTVVPTLGESHKHIFEIASAIHKLNSSVFKVDINNIHTNILMIDLENANFTSEDLKKRLLVVGHKEMADSITDNNGKGVIIKSSAINKTRLRLVTYLQITTEDIKLVIKKLIYVIRELENNN